MEPMATEGREHETLIAQLRRRRVTREFTGAAVTDSQLRLIMEGARWASSASNLRLHRYVLVTDLPLIDNVRMISRDLWPPARADRDLHGPAALPRRRS